LPAYSGMRSVGHNHMSNHLVSADHHFFHERIIEHCKRPFANAEVAVGEMIYRWNDAVKPNDLVYYLGDMFYAAKADQIEEVLKQLNGKIFFIPGNHDKLLKKKFKDRFLSWGDSIEKITEDGQQIVLCHYAMRTWQNSFHGSWQLYGHSHSQLPDDPNLPSFDIGVDCWDYAPVTMDQVFAKMKQKLEARSMFSGATCE